MIGHYDGFPIYITTTEHQRRTHHKRRINKKWRKRYGVIESDSLVPGQMIMMNGALYMSKQTFDYVLRSANYDGVSKSDVIAGVAKQEIADHLQMVEY